ESDRSCVVGLAAFDYLAGIIRFDGKRVLAYAQASCCDCIDNGNASIRGDWSNRIRADLHSIDINAGRRAHRHRGAAAAVLDGIRESEVRALQYARPVRRNAGYN